MIKNTSIIQKRPLIVIVEDDDANIRLIVNALESGSRQFDFQFVLSGQDIRKFLANSHLHLIIADINLLKADELWPDKILDLPFPVILMDNNWDKEKALMTVENGFMAYISKSEDDFNKLPYIAARTLREWDCMMQSRDIKSESGLSYTIEELSNANRKILDQQQRLLEEERDKVLLQIAGATAHKLGQPLMTLLGNIEMIELNKKSPDKLKNNLEKIKDAGQRMSNIVKNMQTIRSHETKTYYNDISIIDLDQELRILLVEDSDHDFGILDAILKNNDNIAIKRAVNISKAVRALKEDDFDLIFLDHYLPDGNSLDFLTFLNKKELDIPVTVITGQGDEMIAYQVIQAGAHDYLPKDKISHKSISRIIINMMEKARLKKEIKSAREKMAELSTRDELTGLYNQNYFMDSLRREISKAARYDIGLELCMMDFDHEKKINQIYGHTAWDMVIAEVGKILKKSVRESDLICRFSHDKFAVILPNTQPEEAKTACERFRGMVENYEFRYNSSQFQVNMSMGIASFNKNVRNTDEFVAIAGRILNQTRGENGNKTI